MNRRALLVGMAFNAALAVCADTIVWTNHAGGTWNRAANWSPPKIPSTNDIAVITNAGAYTVSFNENTALAGLILGGVSGTQTVSMVNRTLVLSGSAIVGTNGILTHTGTSAIHGSNSVLVSGLFRWQGGVLGTNTALSISPEGSLVLSSGGTFAKTTYGTITNAGTMIWQPVGNLIIGGCLNIQPSGSFYGQYAGTIGGDGIIVNDGIFRTSVSGTVNCNVPVINNGTIDNTGGTLTLAGDSTFNSGSAFTGTGLTRINSGTSLINGNVHSDNLSLHYSATLSGTGAISGTLIWSGGTIASNAFLTVQTNGHLRIESAETHSKALAGSLVNRGIITLKPQGDLALSGTLTNLGLFDYQASSGADIAQGGMGDFQNFNTFQVDTGSVTCQVPMSNFGSIKVGAETLVTFQSALHNPQGSIVLEGGGVRCYQPLHLVGGELAGWGTLTADVTNSATVHPSPSNGVLKIVGLYRQLIGGRLLIDITGPLSGTNASKLNVTGPALLHGTVALHWALGSVVTPGDSLEVLTFSSREGAFCAFDNCYRLGQNCRLLPVYNAKSFLLNAVSAPDPELVPLSVSAQGSTVLVSWPAEFSGFSLFSKTNLASAAWDIIPGASNHLLVTPMLPEQYFRISDH